jgi:hypothetical protein
MTDERAQTEDRQLTDDERVELFRGSMSQEVLPDLPPIPGYHVFWATTTNPRDSVPNRIRFGYELITAAELGPRWQATSVKTGEAYAGCIMVNEMIAMKIPLSLYERYMRENHHLAPAREEQKLRDTVDSIRAEAERKYKANVLPEEGTAELAREVRAPTFA